ncbi:NAD-dependent succinate-semialdehyde dehydrogenase [Microvirga sp. ACRRW]|uniref:NAD-dependent succinate-semialdehyde dehydrogenase n=1 Tax=Microvirga sp. ACRRW TaxID=2918205 RepID=UPI001EF51129|nr:NAD-dependent succinate-semialdehyde dehydrogenase [Microvirga sp. ACRRW]MCG7393400.1 NAD-dependent succinate-semialdehyde dehydrogenase [Microvirga sp. ACRRW]
MSVTYPELSLHIGGKRLKGSGARIDVIDPATEKVIGQVSGASAADLDRALAAAEKGFGLWRAVAVHQRCAILRRAAALLRERVESLAAVLVLEQGKSLSEARGEINASAEVFEWFAEEGRRAYGRIIPDRTSTGRMLVVREPVGPVAAFTPWNFPALTPARKIAGALAAGCSIIIKPSEETPATCLALIEACVEAGVPEGAVNMVLGEPATVSAHLIPSQVIRKISFTGSTLGGRAVAALAARAPKRATLELGGHAPVIVCADVDVEAVARLSAKRKFRNAGQVCVSPTRFYVHADIIEPFAAEFARTAKEITLGHGLESGTVMGPLANARRLSAITELVADAQAKGARLLCGGKAVDGPGYFYPPTVLSHVPECAAIMTQEPFGPVAPITPFTDLDEVIVRANALEVGLSAFGFSRDAATVNKLGSALEAGMVGINRFEISQAETPFGGIKESGDGREGGIEGLEAYLTTKTISQA